MFIFVFAGVLCQYGCSRKPDYEAEIVAIDSVAKTDAPRALALLDSLEPRMAGASEGEWCLYSLTRVKVEDKAYVKHKTDTVMLRLVDYYETEGDKRLLPQVYYYTGRVYFDIDDNDRALPYFQKAVELCDTVSILYYKAQAQIGYIFLYQGLYEKGFNAFLKSYNYNKKKGNLANQAYELCAMANCLQGCGKRAQALRYFKWAKVLTDKAVDKSFAAEVTAQIANHYYSSKEYAFALKYARQALAGVDSIGARVIYSISANIYDKAGIWDSAVILCKKLYALDNVYAKYNASKMLGRYYLQRKDVANAAFYLGEYDRYLDSVQAITQTETVAKIDAIYNYGIREDENNRLKDEAIKDKFAIAITVGLLVVAVLASFAIVQYSKKKSLADRVKYENEKRYLTLRYEQSNAFIEENERKIATLQQRLASAEGKSKELASELKANEERLNNLNKMAKIRTENRKLAAAGLESSSICARLFALLNDNTKGHSGKKLSAEDWRKLDEEVNIHYPKFKERIFELCKISDIEYRVCLLLKIGVTPKAISTLTIKTKSAISVMRKRLYAKAFNKDETPEKWDEFIRSL